MRKVRIGPIVGKFMSQISAINEHHKYAIVVFLDKANERSTMKFVSSIHCEKVILNSSDGKRIAALRNYFDYHECAVMAYISDMPHIIDIFNFMKTHKLHPGKGICYPFFDIEIVELDFTTEHNHDCFTFIDEGGFNVASLVSHKDTEDIILSRLRNGFYDVAMKNNLIGVIANNPGDNQNG